MDNYGYKQYQCNVEIPQLLLHNCTMADPLNPITKEMKLISKKRVKTDEDFIEMARIEYFAGLYLSAKREVIIPSRLFEAMIATGAKKTKEGKISLSSVFVDTDAVITYDGGPLNPEELWASETHRLVVPVGVNNSKVMRTRPKFENVKASFLVSLNQEQAQADQLRKWIVTGLSTSGLGDGRPRYGRGRLVHFEEV